MPLSPRCSPAPCRSLTAHAPRSVCATLRSPHVATPFLSEKKCLVKGTNYGSESAHAVRPMCSESLTTGGSISGRNDILSQSMPMECSRISVTSLRNELPKASKCTLERSHSSRSSILPSARPRAGFRRGLAKAPCTADKFFIPPVRAADEGKLVVVLDLDETLVYARTGVIIPRPGINRLLDVLRGRCEVVVWTAGEKWYAMEVLHQIDPQCCIQHCVYRHEKWWTDRPGYMKDVAALGRPLHRTIIIDNTPDCLRANTRNGLLVKDFKGLYGGCQRFDNTLFVLADVIEDVLSGSKVSIDAFHNHPDLQRRFVQCDTGGAIEVLTLKQDNFAHCDPPRRHRVTSLRVPKYHLWRHLLGM
ncbi:nuclear lim interactor-interacting factor [Trypanosoma rangeli]|uniref:Mitochondrial import inner membrane translocase subunit TIM50 n=1 Tax=Trypanosoma rangeli TaxID=5698 RepID=A0A3R7LAC9_TRYRA|nr:nuclear lim interactor-interacting factor [Trypanosoma rangeli]RNF10324.1 nuclear lim interactor-interacting factor [Trypanosoma rangeli]|eukprot:RNF10324.1 nuclear lim interactor-interacting factor [Trypanosoma rangeli]